MSTIATVVANPREGSRTHRLADLVADRLADTVGAARAPVVDLATFGAALLDPADSRPAEARAAVAASPLLVVATPVYKATYTGLLKVFLDGYGGNALAGVTAVGVILSAAPAHLLATDIHLRSLLVELGASVPTPSLGLVESQLEHADEQVGAWVDENASLLRRLTASEHTRRRQEIDA